ncbi:MscL family protein [Candidatus Kaiserbacteria bacterium]|nr:MscL family protein [Candidatus Kaiserbacteria bacterium]
MDTLIQVQRTAFSGFLDFIRERGVVGLAVGFIIGGAVTKTVTSLVDDVINPLIGTFAGSSLKLSEMTIGVIKVGSFANNLINLLIVTAVVYFVLFKGLRLNKLDKPKT